MLVRLDKFLANVGLGTRSEVKKQIGFGNVLVNGKAVRKPETKIDPKSDDVQYKKEVVRFEEFVYYVLNKPQGVITATEDKRHKTVMDLIGDKRKGLAPVGRLDIDTEGLLLITNDGELAHQLLSPKKHVDKTYFAKIAGNLPKDAKERFESGIAIGEDLVTMPANLRILSMYADDNMQITEVEVTIREGKFHQVKRMFAALGAEVLYLKRIRMGGLSLLELNLEQGEYRMLREDELLKLKQQR